MNDRFLKNQNLDVDLKKKINLLKKKYSFSKFLKIYKNIKKKKILVIGDPIIDVYRYGGTVGTSSKSPSIAFLENNIEYYKGGSIAVAEMLSNLGFDVDLLIFREINTKIKISKKINLLTPFTLSKMPKIERFVDNNRSMVKLLQLYNLENIKLPKKKEKLLINLIIKNKSDLMLVIDFGFGLLTKNVIEEINVCKTPYSLNCHLNSLNYVTNYYDKYEKFNFITFNKKEFEFSFRGQKNFNKKINEASSKLKSNFAITLGNAGSTIISDKKEFHFPAINKNILDPVGCGDAFFAITSVFNKFYNDPFLTNFVGNIYAGIHGQFICNKQFCNEKEFLRTIKVFLN